MTSWMPLFVYGTKVNGAKHSKTAAMEVKSILDHTQTRPKGTGTESCASSA